MAQEKLWPYHSVFCALTACLLAAVLTSCRAEDKPIGMTLLFQSAGHDVGVLRFDPDGVPGPVPGAVGGMYPRGGAIMSFMPGDSKHSVPKFVDVAWMVATPEYKNEREALHARKDEYSDRWMEDSDRSNERAPHYTKHVDLTGILNADLIAQTRANARTTQLKLVITFNNENVDIKAMAYKWR